MTNYARCGLAHREINKALETGDLALDLYRENCIINIALVCKIHFTVVVRVPN